jgi:response regulator RpfG family c-di-GMP phosphodiesterase
MKSPSDCNTNAILLLDDEFDITFSFKQGLEDKGYHVFGFTEPLLALDHFQMNSEQYSLVISDIRMPVINGYEFIKKVKEIKPLVKVFLMTAFKIDDIEFRKELPFVIVDEIIQKPILLEDFTSAIIESRSSNVDVHAEPYTC